MTAKILLDQTSIDSLEQNITYNGDGTVDYITATNGEDSYRQTFTYSGGKLASISPWVKQ